MSQPELQPGPQSPQPAPGGNFAGCALFGIGLLMLIPSGLCTTIGGFMLIGEFVDNPQGIIHTLSEFSGFIAITLIPLAFGIALVIAGLRARR